MISLILAICLKEGDFIYFVGGHILPDAIYSFQNIFS